MTARVTKQIPVISLLLVLSAGIGVVQAESSAHENNRSQKAPSLDQILDKLTKSDLDREGLDQSNVAIDQMVQKTTKLIGKASKQRNKELKSKNPDSPLSKILRQTIDTLTDCNSYLLKLKELQSALIEVQSRGDGPDIDPDDACKEMNLEFDAIGADLRNLKLGLKTLSVGQRLIVDVYIWELGSKLTSAIYKIQQRALQVGTALTLESEADLSPRF